MIIGLTGGIGTGKSTVCGIFKHIGVPIIDADAIAHHIVDTDNSVLQAIIKKFGAHYLTKQQKLDRQQLRDRIFKDPSEKMWLENLLHPLILAEIKRQTQSVTYPYCVVAVPLLVEAGWQKHFDRILTVDCSEDLQLQRAMQRPDYTEEQVRAIIASQINRNKRLAATNDVIENSGDLAALTERVKKLHTMYLNMV